MIRSGVGKDKKIEFFCEETWIDLPRPAREFIPDWYKKSERFRDNKIEFSPDRNVTSKDLKLCIPFLDSLTAGYVFCLWQDLLVSQSEEDGTTFDWESDFPLMNERTLEANKLLPRPAGHFANNFVWECPLMIRVPRGYSVLITHPFNRFDLPFTTLTGIVDADSMMITGNVPFFINDNFTGVIRKGTPIFQIIPFKRESWVSSVNEDLSSLNYHISKVCRSVLSGGYRDNFWHRKKFN